MNTFLPYKSFTQTAKCLDYRRLGKQRLECRQIIDILENKTNSKAWRNHPAVLMWKGYETVLKYYFNCISQEWMDRGYRHNMGFYFPIPQGNSLMMPWWVGGDYFHQSHQSNLVRKFPEHYRNYFPDVPDDLPYIWPTKQIGGL